MKSLRIAGLVLAALIIHGTTATAQAIDIYELRIYAPGVTAAPIAKTALLPAEIVCNTASIPQTNVVNPAGIQWDDPVNAGKTCVWRQSAVGPIVSLPIGAYEAVLVRTTDAGTSPESNRAGFSKAPLPGAVTGLKPVR